MCDMTQSYVWHDSIICVTWLNHMCDMTQSCVWHDSFTLFLIVVTRLSHTCDMTQSCVTWLIHTHSGMCDMTQSYVWHDSFTLILIALMETRISTLEAMTHSYVWHDSYILETWLIHICDAAHLIWEAWPMKKSHISMRSRGMICDLPMRGMICDLCIDRCVCAWEAYIHI